MDWESVKIDPPEYRVQYFGKGGRWVWTRTHFDFDACLQLAKNMARKKGVETRVWTLTRWESSALMCYVAPDGAVTHQRPPFSDAPELITLKPR